MTGLTKLDCVKWLESHGAGVAPDGRPLLMGAGSFGFAFQVPAETRARIVLADSLARHVNPAGGLLWLTDWPIYSATEMALFDRVRARFGEDRRLIEAPGHEFSDDPAEAGVECSLLVLLVTALNWEGYLFGGDHQSVTWLADEIMEFWTHNASQAAAIALDVQSLGVKVRSVAS